MEKMGMKRGKRDSQGSTKKQPQESKKNNKKQRLKGKHRFPDEEFSFAEADDRLFDIFRNHDFEGVSHELRHRLLKFYFLLMKEQRRQNITRILTLRETGIKHFIDCLMVTRLTRLTYPLLDVGSGAGFPGIPLRIIEPKGKMILAEGVQKRVEFLKRVREELELSELDIIGRNIDEEFVYPVQGVITRALKDIPLTLRLVDNCLQTKGKIFLMKGPNVDTELKEALKEFQGRYVISEDHAYTLPRTPHKRRLIVLQKIGRAT
jgi:16S rRNA (guanine527-N7)-methyltransferase